MRSMFDSIAPRYDLVNFLMTFGLDASWRRRTIEMLALLTGARSCSTSAAERGIWPAACAAEATAPSGSTSPLGCSPPHVRSAPLFFRPTPPGSPSGPGRRRGRERIRAAQLRRSEQGS